MDSNFTVNNKDEFEIRVAVKSDSFPSHSKNTWQWPT